MPRTSSGTVHVFTFRQGLLARLGHDLQLRLTRFEISHEAGRITGTFWTNSLVVERAVGGGALSPADKATIEQNIVRDVLDTARAPTARLNATARPAGDGHDVTGTLSLNGREQVITLHIREAGGLTGSMELTPSRWGVRPYRAFAGALRLEDRVRVELALPPLGAWD